MRAYSGAFPIELEARFSFFAVLGFLICTDKDGVTLLCLLACVLHELGHIAVMTAEGKPPSSVTLYGGGIRISGGSTDIPAVIAGVAVNLALFALLGIVPWENGTLRLFGVMNLPVALFNLLPVRELDGKLLLDKLLIRLCTPERAILISDICERLTFALVLPAAVIAVLSGYLNISALIFFFYLLAVEILEKM